MVGRVRLVLDSGCVLREASEGGRAVRLSAAAAFEAGLLKEEHVARLETIISQLRARLPLPAAGGSGHKRKAPEPAEVQACGAIRPLGPMSATRQKLPCGILPPRSSYRLTCCSSLAVLSCPAAAHASAGLRRLTAGLAVVRSARLARPNSRPSPPRSMAPQARLQPSAGAPTVISALIHLKLHTSPSSPCITAGSWPGRPAQPLPPCACCQSAAVRRCWAGVYARSGRQGSLAAVSPAPAVGQWVAWPQWSQCARCGHASILSTGVTRGRERCCALS